MNRLARLTAAAACAALLPAAASAAPPVAEPPPATTGPVDGLVSSPDNFKLLLENDRVRVLQYTLPPGALDHWHTHPPRVGPRPVGREDPGDRGGRQPHRL